MGTPKHPTPKTPRLSTEEMQRLFNDGEYWRRMQEGEFTEVLIGYHKVGIPGVLERHPDARGKSTYYIDRFGTKVAEVHYYVLPDDSIIPNKRPDPKRVLHRGAYCKQECRNQRERRLEAEAAQRSNNPVQ